MAHAGQAVTGPVLASFAIADQDNRCQKKGEGHTESDNKSHHEVTISILLLAAKVIEVNIFLFHAETVEHVKDRLVHHRWTTQVVVNVLGGRMVL